MLGQILVHIFSYDNQYQVVAWDKDNLDITKEKEVIEAIKDMKPDVVISAAAYTDVDGAETNKDIALKVNGKAVGYLSRASHQSGAFFIQISTDYVFGQEKKQGYKEEDIPQNPLNVYGESKLLGEKLLLQEAKKGLDYYLIRTSWLFGPGGKNFVQTMLDLAKTHSQLKIVNDQYGRPTYSYDLAQTIKNMIERQLPSGIYHFTNNPELNWYRFAQIIFAVKKELDPDFKIPGIIAVSSDKFPRPAHRPHFSVLLNTKLPQGRDIQEALKDYLQK